MTDDFNIITDDFIQKYKDKKPNWGFNGLGYIVYKRTYARIVDENTKQTEEWHQTLQRCINGAQKIGAQYTKEEAERLYDLMFNLKCSFAGRMLWQLGTSTVDRFGANSLLNCWFTTIEKIEDFCFIFENLMLGGGVGFSVKREHVHELPKVKENVTITVKDTKDADFIIPDSREGWVELLRKVLESYFITGKSFTYSTILLRGYGELIRGFGGTASGPKVLVEGISNICGILEQREGKKIRSIDALDICNIIGSVVVAGNVRRSALIAIGDPDDMLFIKAKRWDLGGIPNWRSMSNNSVYVDSYDHIMENVWDGYGGNGEPYGFINLDLSRKVGRLGEKKKDMVEGFNPCAEISLHRQECCDLAEIFLNNISDKAELLDCTKLLYKTQKAILALPFLHKETELVVRKNMRIGASATGICQVDDEKLSWLDEAYITLRKFDIEWSKKNGWNESIKLTCVKPSGTLSLLAGSTPGIHPAFSRHYIRRVRMSSSDPLVSLCRKHGYYVEFVRKFDGTNDHSTVVVEFPCMVDEKTITAAQMSAIKQLELVKKLQTIWADNAVSVTVYYKKEELPEIRQWLKTHYKTSIKSVSFLLHSEHGFDQAPYEQITEDVYNKILSRVKSIEQNSILNFSDSLDGLECEGGACPIK